jgi:transcriptional regulator with XRE-family HTH domain
MNIKQIDAIRTEKHISNRDFAQAVGIHEISWYRIKRTGRSSGRFIENAEKILLANALNTSKEASLKGIVQRIFRIKG